MKVAYRQSFVDDIHRIKDRSVRIRIEKAIGRVEESRRLADVPNIRRLSGADNCYRIRVGDYRLGLRMIGDEIEFMRCLHRREIYRYFP